MRKTWNISRFAHQANIQYCTCICNQVYCSTLCLSKRCPIIFFLFLFRYIEYVKTSEDSFKCLASMFRKPQKYSVKRLDMLKFSVEILEISKVQFQGVVSPKSRALRRCNCEKFGARGFTSRGSSLSKCRRI